MFVQSRLEKYRRYPPITPNWNPCQERLWLLVSSFVNSGLLAILRNRSSNFNSPARTGSLALVWNFVRCPSNRLAFRLLTFSSRFCKSSETQSIYLNEADSKYRFGFTILRFPLILTKFTRSGLFRWRHLEVALFSNHPWMVGFSGYFRCSFLCFPTVSNAMTVKPRMSTQIFSFYLSYIFGYRNPPLIDDQNISFGGHE
jgi:hypothetical protein